MGIGDKINNGLENITIAKIVAGEAAGEGRRGMQAVLNVMVNRARRRGKTLYEIATAPHQFSAYADKALMERNYREVKPIVDSLVASANKLEDITGGATNYVTKSLYAKKKNDPNSWISKMTVTKIIGNHVFLK